MLTWARNACVVGMFVVCAAWGIWKASSCRARAQMLAAMGALLSDMRQALALQGMTPGQWAHRYDGPLSLPRMLADGMDGQPDLPLSRQWEHALTQFISLDAMASTLTDEDVALLKKLGAGLEAGHPAGLEEHLSFYIGELGRRAAQASQEAERKRGMYMRVGLLTGLGCVIMFI